MEVLPATMAIGLIMLLIITALLLVHLAAKLAPMIPQEKVEAPPVAPYDLVFTSTRPTESGWYWFKRGCRDEDDAMIVQVLELFKPGELVYGVYGTYPPVRIAPSDVLWAGPIPYPAKLKEG